MATAAAVEYPQPETVFYVMLLPQVGSSGRFE